MFKRWLLFWLAGGLAAAALFFWNRQGPEEERFNELSPAVVSEDGVVNVGAIRLWQDYESNAVAADSKYRGKTIRIAARVTGIDKQFSGDVVLELGSGNPIFRSMATLQEGQTAIAASLVRGQEVVIRCVGGEVMMRIPQLENCRVLEVIPLKAT